MVAIDVNATLSIVAADGGDANGGLKGLRGQLRPITAHQIVMELSSKLSLCRRWRLTPILRTARCGTKEVGHFKRIFSHYTTSSLKKMASSGFAHAINRERTS
jgi:hypothetical protein